MQRNRSRHSCEQEISRRN